MHLFCSPFILLLAVSAALAASELKIRLSGPEYIDHVMDLKVISTMINGGKKTLNILHDPRGLLSDLPADKFLITKVQNHQPKFIGIKAKFVPTFAADSGAYTTLKPGQSIAVEHNLSIAYDFSTSGVGEYTFLTSGCLYVVDDSGEVSPFHAEVEHHVAKIGAKLMHPRRTGTVSERRPKFVGCSSSQESQIAFAIPTAVRYAKTAFNHLQTHKSGTPRYTTWFGEYDHERHNTVLSHFKRLHDNGFSSFKYDCSCSNAEVFAYVYPDQFGTIHLCDGFWQAPTSGTDSKAGTLIHESLHFNLNGGTLDDAYGQEASEELANEDPNDAVFNADSHEYFAENDPALN
ncbi:hypothetical protein APHAL10511_006802 [Amanita phalloides]|nr:hypothetical protein APHAL10511_006802 [Amanita phalloides]